MNGASKGNAQTRLALEAAGLFMAVADKYVFRYLLAALFFVAMTALLVGLSPLALKYAVDQLAANESGRGLVPPVLMIVSYVALLFFSRLFTELRTFSHGRAEQRVRRYVGLRLFQHLVHLPLRFHLDRKVGTIGETAEQGIRGYELLLEHLIYTIVPVVIEFAIIITVLVHLGQSIYIAILGAAAVAYVAAFYRGAATMQASIKSVTESNIEAHGVLNDCLVNAEAVKCFCAEASVTKSYDKSLSNTEAAWRVYFRRRAVNGLWISVIFAVSLATSLLYAASGMATGAMSVGDFVLVNSYVIRLVVPLELLGVAIRDISQGLAFLEKLLDLLGERAEANLPSGASRSRESGGELEFDRVGFSYQPERPILRDISFRVPVGRTLAIAGVSGSGKSSLIRILFRLYEPTSGEVRLDGVRLTDMPISSVRQSIALVPQDTVLFHDTIWNNIAFGKAGATREEVERAAKLADLHELIMSLPDGYDTMVGERGLKVSGGERQRIAIARAAMKRPRVFVFDEATSSLDSATERAILRNLANISCESTTLMIAHRLSTVVAADEILVLDKGAVVERGSHEVLLAKQGRYAALWWAQQSTPTASAVRAVETGR